MPRKPYRTFDEQVDASGGENACHKWTGPRVGHAPYRYGRHYGPKSKGKPLSYWPAHRYAYERAFGPIPRDSIVRHICDVMLCVNVRHLVLGTQRDNMHDRIVHGAGYTVGTAHHNAKLTPETVTEARRLHFEKGVSFHELARRLGLDRHTITAAVKSETWFHVPNQWSR